MLQSALTLLASTVTQRELLIMTIPSHPACSALATRYSKVFDSPDHRADLSLLFSSTADRRIRSAPLSLPTRLVNKYMVGDAVPRIVNAGEEQQQRGSSNAKQGLPRMEKSRERAERE